MGLNKNTEPKHQSMALKLPREKHDTSQRTGDTSARLQAIKGGLGMSSAMCPLLLLQCMSDVRAHEEDNTDLSGDDDKLTNDLLVHLDTNM